MPNVTAVNRAIPSPMRLRVVKVGSNPVRKTAPATAMAIPIHACGRIDSCRKTWANMATKTGAVYVMASECAVLVNQC